MNVVATRTIVPVPFIMVSNFFNDISNAAHAVELARWEIPLILVARDLTRLTSLAYDLEACYGVKCCVIQADLSKPHVAEQIHLATSRAGLRVDVLVNNAGVSHNGLAVDMPIEDVDTAIMTNVNSVAKLTHLYGKDMKEKRRGRILMVSSVVGAVSAGPTVALYAATKSFEKMLGLSIAKELEPYGVGVTCLMPGAVRDTDFRTRSKSHEAICWKIPFYTKAPSEVAKLGVRSLLRGDVEVTPGILNRVFLKVLKPGMPQRLHNIIVEMAWNPLQIPPFLKIWQSEEKRQKEREMQLERRYKDGYDEAQEQDKELKRSEMQEQTWQPRYNSAARGSPPPLMLVVPEERSSPPQQQQETVPWPIAQPDAQKKHIDGGNASEPIAAPPSKIDANATEDKIKKSKDEYAALRNLQGEFDSDSDDISPSIPSPEAATNNSDPSTSSTISAPQSDQSPDSYQRLPEQQQSSSAMSQLQEQVRQLQEKVQDQERQQFLQQLEQQRQQRELEFEKRELERQKKEQREEVEARQKEHQEEQKQRHGSKKPNEGSWIKRKPQRRTTDRPQDSKDKKPTKKEKPTVIQQDTDKDILTESLEHPLLSRL